MLPMTDHDTSILGLRRAQIVCIDDERYRARLRFLGDDVVGEQWAEIAVADPTRLVADSRVLAARTEDDAWVVLAVLGRPAANPLVVECDPATGDTLLSPAAGNLVLSAPQGDVRLEAGRTVALEGQRLTAAGKSADLLAGRTTMRADMLRCVARKHQARYGDADVRAQQWRLSATRIVTRARTLYEQVEGLSQRTAQRARTIVEGLWQLRAGRMVARAKGDVRIDGKKINLG